jgi:hypothetical protein
MIAILRTIALRVAICAAVSWGAWRLGFSTGVLFMIGVLGIAMARPLLDLASELRHQMRRANWRHEEGRYYVFRGIPVRVLEDSDKQRWVRLADARRIVGFTASTGALKITYPSGFRLLGRPPEPYLGDEAMLAHMLKERSATAGKFRHWVEREIVFPARRERERLGIRLDRLDVGSSD